MTDLDGFFQLLKVRVIASAPLGTPLTGRGLPLDHGAFPVGVIRGHFLPPFIRLPPFVCLLGQFQRRLEDLLRGQGSINKSC